MNAVKQKKNVRNLVLLALGVAQIHMRDWKGKDATIAQEELMNVQAKIMDVQEMPSEEFIAPPQLELFERRL